MAPPPIPDEEWERIWAPLEAQGWRHEGVPGGVNYFFPPGVVKGEGNTLRKDYFDSKRQVVNRLGIEIKQPVAKRGAEQADKDRAPKRKRQTPTPTPTPTASASDGASGGDGQEEDQGPYGEERRSSRVKKLRDMPSAEELRIMKEKQAAEKAAYLKKWLEAQPVASHKSEWLGPANARVPPNRESGEQLTKIQQQQIAPWADNHRTWKLSWFNGAPQSKNMRKTAPFNRMYSNRAVNGVYGLPAPLLKDAFHGVVVPPKPGKK